MLVEAAIYVLLGLCYLTLVSHTAPDRPDSATKDLDRVSRLGYGATVAETMAYMASKLAFLLIWPLILAISVAYRARASFLASRNQGVSITEIPD